MDLCARPIHRFKSQSLSQHRSITAVHAISPRSVLRDRAASLEAQAAAKQKELNGANTLLREVSNLHTRLTDSGSGNEALADLASAAHLDTEVRTWALHELSSADERFAALVAEAQLMAEGDGPSVASSARSRKLQAAFSRLLADNGELRRHINRLIRGMLDRPQPSAAHAPAAQPSSAHAEPHIESSAVPASPPTQRPLHTAGPAEEFLPAASESATSDRQSLAHELTSPPPTVGVHSAKSSAFADQLPAHSAALASTPSAADDQQPAAGELGSQSPVAGDLPAALSGPAKQQLTGSGLDNGQRKHSLPEPQSNGLESSTHTVNPAEVHSAARDNIASHAAVPDTAIAAQLSCETSTSTLVHAPRWDQLGPGRFGPPR
ncbi:hypothetical protein WJX84_010480 [Apatococcus fuscideae]|uniref:Uncharacterized protein n=1 Tax=Apatococcus fuscideae TaxID=2026836 RepID=A0AAW1SRI8_9CHLO